MCNFQFWNLFVNLILINLVGKKKIVSLSILVHNLWRRRAVIDLILTVVGGGIIFTANNESIS